MLRLINDLIGVKFKITLYEKDDYDEEIPEDEENSFEEDEDNFNDVEMDDENNFDLNKNNENQTKYIFSCVGVGLKNVARIEG